MATNDQKIYLQGLTASGVPYDQAVQIVDPASPIPSAQKVGAGPLLFQPDDPRVGDGWITTPPSGASDFLGGLNSAVRRGFELFSRQQQNIEDLGKGKDWRVRISLGEGSDKLYKDGNRGILAPLADTDGVVFPYTPTIQVNYTANYNSTDLTHSNMRANFYQGSSQHKKQTICWPLYIFSKPLPRCFMDKMLTRGHHHHWCSSQALATISLPIILVQSLCLTM